MRAGLLREVVEVWAPTTIINEYGQQETTFTLSYTTRARLLHKNGGRDIENGEVVFNYTKTFELRHYCVISELDRLKWNGKFYRITDITPRTENMSIEVNCELINE